MSIASYNYFYYYDFAQYLASVGRHQESLAYYLDAVRLAPWNQMLYDELVMQYTEYFVSQLSLEDPALDEELVSSYVEILVQHQDKLEIQAEARSNGFRFSASNRLLINNAERRFIFGRAYFYIGDFELALEYLGRIGLGSLDDDPDRLIRVIIYRLLAYEYLGMEEDFNKLIQSSRSKDLGIPDNYEQLKQLPMWQLVVQSQDF